MLIATVAHIGRAAVAALVLVGSRALAPSPGAAQQDAVAPIQLRPATATIPEVFSRVSAVRELPDGRVLVVDEQETRLVIADPRSGTVTPVGRRGNGPGEFRQLGRLWLLRADSSLVKEPYAPRWLLLRGATITATLGPGEPVVARAGQFPLMGADTLGNVYAVQFGRDGSGRLSPTDSLVLVRVNRRTLRTDTIARLRPADAWSRSVGTSSGPPVAAAAGGGGAARRFVIGIQAPDQAIAFPDGWVAVARVDPHRVDWCPPAGRCVPGREIPAPRVNLSERERRYYLEVAARTHGSPPTTDVAATTGWPPFLPAFVVPPGSIDGSALHAMPDGRLMIARQPTSGSPFVRHDIVSRAGRVEGWLRLPVGEQVVGFGVASIYILITDAEGGQRVRRHPW